MAVADKSIDPRLLKCAREEFLKKGFPKAELKVICENAGITTGAVYKRYKGKEDLFCATVAQIADMLTAFCDSRSSVDLKALTDEQLYDSWIMTYDTMIPIYKMVYPQRESFILLTQKSAGTRYEDFNHEFVNKMCCAYEQYYLETVRRGLAQEGLTREELHTLLSSFWTCICEPIVHDLGWDKVEEHCHVICRFFNWKDVIMLKKGNTDNV
ncbi:MAG: TetR/AcrR family transcriptional regulator [Saccharofermentans sp.]|nr:TetR/AcrR family transcriptional regulator [Saccharofermentans sp.]